MRINEYSTANPLKQGDVLIVDGADGTRKVEVTDFMYQALDAMNQPAVKNGLSRGKSLGNSITTTQLSNIRNGTFRDLWLGDYWTMGGKTWRIVDINYWAGHTGTDVAEKFTTPHLVIMPDEPLYQAKMHDSNGVSMGYFGSTMRNTNLNPARATISSLFGNKVLKHPVWYTSKVESYGWASASTFVEDTVEIPTEAMIMGNRNMGKNVDNEWGNANHGMKHLKLFNLWTWVGSYATFWTRDIISESGFVCIRGAGLPGYSTSITNQGVRPVFPIG